MCVAYRPPYFAATRASAWPHAQEFVDENLLVAVDRDEAIAALESRRT